MVFEGASLKSQEFNVEDEGCIGWDNSGMASFSICIVRRTRQLSSLPHRHFGYTFIPASDDCSLPNFESEWTSTITGGVKLLPIGQCAGVMDDNSLASLRVCLACREEKSV